MALYWNQKNILIKNLDRKFNEKFYLFLESGVVSRLDSRGGEIDLGVGFVTLGEGFTALGVGLFLGVFGITD